MPVRSLVLLQFLALSLFSSSVCRVFILLQCKVIPIVPELPAGSDQGNQCLFLVWSHNSRSASYSLYLLQNDKAVACLRRIPLKNIFLFCCDSWGAFKWLFLPPWAKVKTFFTLSIWFTFTNGGFSSKTTEQQIILCGLDDSHNPTKAFVM